MMNISRWHLVLVCLMLTMFSFGQTRTKAYESYIRKY